MTSRNKVVAKRNKQEITDEYDESDDNQHDNDNDSQCDESSDSCFTDGRKKREK